MTAAPTEVRRPQKPRQSIRAGVFVVVLVALLAGLFVWSPWSSSPRKSSRSAAAPAGPAPAAPAVQPGRLLSCPASTTRVGSAEQLTAALQSARPGSVIELADGVYGGRFSAPAVSGTSEAPIWLCGGAGAVLDGGGIDGGYGLHLDGVSNWRLLGFSIRNSQKGVVLDRTTSSVLQGLTVTGTGDEAVHLRNFSSGNTVIANRVADTGLRKGKFGEGFYVGTAESNWCDVSNCQPDASDRNVLEANAVTRTTAESVDIKEGTSGGVVRGNTFDGTGMTDADSWVNVKGRGWSIDANRGTNSPGDGFSTHVIVDGFGGANTFRANRVEGALPGYGINATKPLDNVVTCDNTAPNAARGLSNLTCVGTPNS